MRGLGRWFVGLTLIVAWFAGASPASAAPADGNWVESLEKTAAAIQWGAPLPPHHGRGIAMARSLSFASLEYRGCGNQVVACVALSG